MCKQAAGEWPVGRSPAAGGTRWSPLAASTAAERTWRPQTPWTRWCASWRGRPRGTPSRPLHVSALVRVGRGCTVKVWLPRQVRCERRVRVAGVAATRSPPVPQCSRARPTSASPLQPAGNTRTVGQAARAHEPPEQGLLAEALVRVEQDARQHRKQQAALGGRERVALHFQLGEHLHAHAHTTVGHNAKGRGKEWARRAGGGHGPASD